MKKIRVILVDDERSSREELKRELGQYPDAEIIAEAKNADEAKELIEARRPDLIFLDIQMPERSGFDLLESLTETPLVVFTTAFNEYAVKAFEVNALDYLMKPIRRERFAKAMEKIRGCINEHEGRQVFIKDGDKYYFIRLEEIEIIESHGNYSGLRFNGKKVLLKRSLRQWEEMLDSNIFLRINRTQLINTRYISETRKSSKNKLEVIMKTGEAFEVSERQSARLRSLGSSQSG